MDSSKLIKLIRKVVKEEVRKAVKPIVNEVLAEHFVRVLGEARETSKSIPLPSPTIASNSSEDVTKRKLFERKMLQEKINKISGGDPMSEMIFGDLESDDRIAFHAPEGPPGAFIDTDDEGVDLSQFGL